MNDHETTSTHAEHDLSRAGRARCEAMLAHLQTALTRRRRRRTAGRAGLATIAMLTAGASALTLLQPQASAPTQLGPISTGVQAPRVQIIKTDTSITDRLGAGAAAPRLVRIISDDELLALSSADGTSYGLIRTAQGARLIANKSSIPEGSQ